MTAVLEVQARPLKLHGVDTLHPAFALPGHRLPESLPMIKVATFDELLEEYPEVQDPTLLDLCCNLFAAKHGWGFFSGIQIALSCVKPSTNFVMDVKKDRVARGVHGHLDSSLRCCGFAPFL
jgi:hypothetical protein